MAGPSIVQTQQAARAIICASQVTLNKEKVSDPCEALWLADTCIDCLGDDDDDGGKPEWVFGRA